MKKQGLFFTASVFVSMLCFAFCAMAQDKGVMPRSDVITRAKAKPIEVVFKISLDDLAKRIPRSMLLYRAEPDAVAMEQRKSLAKLFGKAGHLETHEQSGGVFAADMHRLWADAPEKATEAKAMDKRAVQASAERFLQRINGLPGKQKTVRQISFDKMERMDKEGKKETHAMSANITYRRLLNGYQGVGPGGKLKVFHDMQGQVAGYMRVWRKLTPEKRPQPVISLREAAERFKRDPLGRVMLAGVTRVEVTALRPAYLELGMMERQKYVQPVYVFDCLAYVKAGDRETKVPYVRYMQALEKPPEALWPGGKSHKIGDRPKTPPKVKVGDD
jgi:hypothetical protein